MTGAGPLAALVLGALAALALGCSGQPLRSGPPTLPSGPVLWAWDRPEDLRSLDPARHAMAVFEAIVTLDHEGNATARPRLHPLRAPAGATLIGVVRIETATEVAGPEVAASGRARVSRARALADAVLAYHRSERTVGLQVDFDARRSERPLYADLLHQLRARLPAGHGLEVTALASWCLGDRWLDGLPIDHAIPMLFRMGPDAEQVRAHLDAGKDFLAPLCRRSVGLSTDEPWPRLPPGRHRYVFHPRPWSERQLRSLTSAR